MKCPKCNADMPDGSRFCKECGTPMTDGLTGMETIVGTPAVAGFGAATPGQITGAETICREFGIDYSLTGRYEIKREIGRGGMGIVYLARDNVLDVDVAIKVLPAMFAANPRAIEALKGEARTAMKLSHPSIVRLHNFIESPEANFLVMEYVEGQSLDEIIHQRGSLPWDETLAIGKQIAAALDYAHSQGVLHRDIKPGNIMITGSGANCEARLADFGIACEMKNTMTRLTGRQTSGTLLYMSPEQLMGDVLDARADIYSFAAMLYECLSGKPPFHSGDIPTQIMQKKPTAIEDISSQVNNALQLALEKDKACRPEACSALIAFCAGADTGLRVSSPKREALKGSPAKGLLVESEPPGATITLNGKQLDEKTPFLFKDLPSGTYDIAVSLERYSPSEKSMYYAGGDEKRITFNLVERLLSEGYRAIEEEGKGEKIGLWKEIIHEKSGIVLRLIPAGEFDMGSPDSEKGRESDEGPVRRVKISQPFYIGKYEVTQKQWQAIMGSNPSNFKGENLPVEKVSWNDIQGFLQKAGGGLRLPTEAQREYACRAGSRTRWCFGDNESALGEYAWYGDNSGDKTHEVGKKKPNNWGLYDMHGNGWEWCEDWYGKDYYSKREDTDPTGPQSGTSRVLRGGSWYLPARGTRTAIRFWVDPDSSDDGNGFRVVVPSRNTDFSDHVSEDFISATDEQAPSQRYTHSPAKNKGKTVDDSKLYVTCPNCGQHDYAVPKPPGSYRFRCPNTKYILGCGKYVRITVKKNGKIVAY